MRVFLTEADGLLGRRLALRLAEAGHAVVGVARAPEGALELEAHDAEGLVLHVAEPLPHWIAAVTRAAPEVVVHLADRASGPRGGTSARRLEAATRTVVDTCVATRARWGFPRRLVFGGSAVVGDAGGLVLTEDVPLTATTARGRALLAAEALAQASVAQGLEVIALRPSRVYGAGGWLRQMVRALRRGRYFVPGTGRNAWDLVHVDDAADAFVRAAEADTEATSRPELFHVVDDTPLTMMAFVTAVAQGLGAPEPRSWPVWLARLVYGREAVEWAVRSARSSNARLRAQLGWAPRWPDARAALPALLAELTERDGVDPRQK